VNYNKNANMCRVYAKNYNQLFFKESMQRIITKMLLCIEFMQKTTTSYF
jgi:hypothetical protein